MFKMTQHDTQPRKRRMPFRRRDIERAIKSARAEGLDIGGVEVVTRDGTTIRILSKDARARGSDLDDWMATRGNPNAHSAQGR